MTHKHPARLIWLPTGGHIGDGVMIAAFFADLLEHNPGLEIVYVVRRNAPLLAELVSAYPSVIVTPIVGASFQSLASIASLFTRRAVVTMLPSCDVHPLALRILCALLRLRGDTVIGFRAPVPQWTPYHHIIDHRKSERYIDCLRHAAARVRLATHPIGTPPTLSLKSSLPAHFPFASRHYIAIHPFPWMSTRKTLPLRRWKELVVRMRQKYPAYGIVITGSEIDRAQGEAIAAGDKDVAFIVCPLIEEAGIIEHAAAYIGVDTGPTHIAGVIGAPSIILAQQSAPAWLPSYNPHAILLWDKAHCRCGVPDTTCEEWEDGKPYRRCVYFVSDEEILAALDTMLKKMNDEAV